MRDLHDVNIKNFKVKIYRLCTGAKGWSKKEQTKMWKAHEKNGKLALELKDKDGIPLINKQKQNQRRRVIKDRVDSFIEEDFFSVYSFKNPLMYGLPILLFSIALTLFGVDLAVNSAIKVSTLLNKII